MFFFWIRLKSAARLSFWLAALAVPLALLAMGAVFGRSDGFSIQIGVYGADARVFDSLAAYGAEDWSLRRYYDRVQLRNDVANRRLELGYVFTDGGILLYASPATVTDRVTNLLVAAAHLETVAGEVGARVLPSVSAADIQALVDGYLADGPLMDRLVVVHGDGVVLRAVPFRRLFHGLFALFAQLLAMLCALGTAERDVMRRLRVVGRGKVALYVFAGFAAVFVMTGAVMAVSAAAGAVFFPGVWVMGDVFPALVYLLVVCAAAFGLVLVLPDGVYPAVLALGFVFTALMGGVLFDLREVLGAVSFLRYFFPSHYYMNALWYN